MAAMQGASDAEPSRPRAQVAQPDYKATRTQLQQVVGMLEARYPAAAEVLAHAEADDTSYADVPKAHWRKNASTNPLERVNEEIKRLSSAVGPTETVDVLAASVT